MKLFKKMFEYWAYPVVIGLGISLAYIYEKESLINFWAGSLIDIALNILGIFIAGYISLFLILILVEGVYKFIRS